MPQGAHHRAPTARASSCPRRAVPWPCRPLPPRLQEKAELDEVQRYICNRAAGVCKKKSPPLKARTADERFLMLTPEEKQMQDMQANLKETGMSGTMYRREAPARGRTCAPKRATVARSRRPVTARGLPRSLCGEARAHVRRTWRG